MLSLQLGQTAQFHPSLQFCKQQTAPLINCSTTILFVSVQVAVDPKLVPRMPYNGRPGRGQKSFTNAGQGLGFSAHILAAWRQESFCHSAGVARNQRLQYSGSTFLATRDFQEIRTPITSPEKTFTVVLLFS